MRVVIVDALAARFGGTAYAAIQIAEHLASEPGVEAVVVTRRGSIVAAGLQPRAGLRVVSLRRAGRLELLGRVAWEGVMLPSMAGRADAVLSWSGMLPRRLPARVVSYLANPVMFERGGIANVVRRWAARRTARDAAHILVPTRASIDRVAGALGRPVQVLPLGVDHGRFSPGDRPGDELLCVADSYVHKRHDIVLAAWAGLPVPRPRLRLIGNLTVDRPSGMRLRALVERHRALGEIVLESELSLSELVAAYRAARVCVLPSEYESFSLPVLEAQACGVPAVVRDLPALRVTGGPATTYVHGDDTAAWSRAIGRLFADDVLHARVRSEGIMHARSYSWEIVGENMRGFLLGDNA